MLPRNHPDRPRQCLHPRPPCPNSPEAPRPPAHRAGRTDKMMTLVASALAGGDCIGGAGGTAAC